MHWGTTSPRSWLTSNDNKHSSRVNRSFIYFLPVRLILDTLFDIQQQRSISNWRKNASHLLFNLSDSGAHTHEAARIRERIPPEQASSCTLDLFDNLGKSNIIASEWAGQWEVGNHVVEINQLASVNSSSQCSLPSSLFSIVDTSYIHP